MSRIRPLELVQLGLIAVMFLIAASAWAVAPERIPIHWNLQGEVDGYGGKFVGLLLLPLMAFGLYWMLLLLPRLDPGKANYESFAKVYGLIRVTVIVFMAGLYAVTVLAALGYAIDMSMVVGVGVGLLMAILGNFMGKIRPNWFAGIRTPWTLSSKLSWDKTHRVGGWFFLGLGILIALTGITQNSIVLVATVVFGMVGLIGLVVYSYLVFRDDPDRISPAGTLPEPKSE